VLASVIEVIGADRPASFEQQAFEPQLAVQDLQRPRQIELLLAGKEVADATW
jgi:hypothetical protein